MDNVCSICNLEDKKYRCPRCQRILCSLKCVKVHKFRFSCDGKLSHPDVNSWDDYTDEIFSKDFKLIEEGERMATSGSYFWEYGYDSSKRIKFLKEQALKLGISLIFAPKNMSIHQKNKSKYEIKLKELRWTICFKIELISSSSTEFLRHGLSGEENLADVFVLFLNSIQTSDNVLYDKLASNYPDNIVVLIQLNDGKFSVVDLSKSINQSLVNKCILEFPTYVVILSGSIKNYTLA